jgi:ribosomal protein S18 acetylase RimI-like enzyme
VLIRDAMDVRYQTYLPEKLRHQAVRLYLCALQEKLLPIFDNLGKAHFVLADAISPTSCLTAFSNRQLVGIVGLQSSSRGFITPHFKIMEQQYGLIGALYRMIGLLLLHHQPSQHEIYIDGIAVDPAHRGKGIGSELLHLLVTHAKNLGAKKLSLDVTDTNHRAKKLYQHFGFQEKKTQPIWPLSLAYRFPFQATTFMEMRIS